LIIAFSLGPDPIYRGKLSEEDFEDISEEKTWTYLNKTYYFTGEINEDESIKYDISHEKMFIDKISLNLSWSDEKDIKRLRRFENKGDTFEGKIFIDDNLVDKKSNTNIHDKSGNINLNYDSNISIIELRSNGTVEIKLLECDEYYPVFGLNLITIEDNSNNYNLEIIVRYKEHI